MSAIPEIPRTARVELDPRSAALIVVDMQNDFVSEGGSLLVPSAAATVPAIGSLVSRFRDAGAHVVFTQDTHREGDPEWRIWPEHTREGTWGWEIVDALAPLPAETVVRKPRYDAFYGTPLDQFLRVWGVRSVVLCGTVANICVQFTAASAALRWYDVVLVEDAISALDPFDLTATLRQTTAVFAGRVVSVAGLELRGG